MHEKDILREVMHLNGVTQVELAKKLGYRNQSSVGSILMRNNISIENITHFLHALDCDLIIRSRKPVKAPGGAEYVPEWVVRGEEDQSGVE